MPQVMPIIISCVIFYWIINIYSAFVSYNLPIIMDLLYPNNFCIS